MNETAIDIMEHDAELTDEQIDALSNDARLAQECRDIFIATGALMQEPQDTEQQLIRFHKKHNTNNTHRLVYRIAMAIATTAACITAILTYTSHHGDDSNAPLLIKADIDIQPRLTDSHGASVPLKMYANSQSPSDPIVISTECRQIQSPIPAIIDTVSLTIPKGHSCRVDLADGTKVYLHPGSRLNYPSAFGSNSRNVRLEGEAYFIVAKDTQKPFIVSTNRSQTIVTGTEFNVKAYNTKESVTLINGKIQFMSNSSELPPVEVLPGQEASLAPSGALSVCEADTMQYTAWRDGYNYYEEATVAEILRQIGISYNVSIECYNRSLLSYRMHYVVRRDISLFEAVRQLNRMGKINAEVVGNKKIVVK